MGKVRRLAGAAVVAITVPMLFAGLPARAAMGPYKIVGGSTAETHFTERAFVTGDPVGAAKRACDPAFTSLPANGVDGYVVDISSLVAKGSARIDYTILGGPTVPLGVGSLQAYLYTAGCAHTGAEARSEGSIPGAASGHLDMGLPGDAKWLVVDSTVTANVNFTVS
jgi:hypothetical protein